MKQYFIECWLKFRGWKIYDYPFPRGTFGYQYSVYSHPDISGVGRIEWAVKKSLKYIIAWY